MKNKLYFILLCLCITCLVQAQSVGILTTEPKGIFHIDPKQDTSGDINTSDDVIVDTNGRLGIGVINPQEKVDINGTFQLIDGTQEFGKKLVSDALGRAVWKDTHFNPISVWILDSPPAGINISLSTNMVLSGTGSFKVNEIGLTTTANYVTVPPGTYIVLMRGALDTRLINGVQTPFRSYGRFSLRNEGGEIVFLFTSILNGNSYIYRSATPSTIYIGYASRNLNPYIGIYDSPPFAGVKYSFSIIFVQL